MSKPILGILAAAGCGLIADATLAGESSGDKQKSAASQEKSAAGAAPSSGNEPTYKIGPDGKVSWAVYEGFKRYHGECHICHGPNGLGSTFAPALAETMKTTSYAQFKDIISNGKASGEKAMPAYANNPNVMCYVDSIYVYLKARADGKLAAGDEAVENKEEKSQEAKDAEKQCMK